SDVAASGGTSARDASKASLQTMRNDLSASWMTSPRLVRTMARSPPSAADQRIPVAWGGACAPAARGAHQQAMSETASSCHFIGRYSRTFEVLAGAARGPRPDKP